MPTPLNPCSALGFVSISSVVWVSTVIPGLCCKSWQQCFHSMEQNGCGNALVGKSCWDSMWGPCALGAVPGACHPQPRHCLEDYWLPQAKTVPGTTLTGSSAQAHHRLPYFAFQTLPSSPSALWLQFSLLCPTFSDFFFTYCFFKTLYSQCPPQKLYTCSTSTYLSFPRIGIFNN